MVKVNNDIVESGEDSDWINLNPGDNTITIQVTAEDGTTTKTYTITVRRQSNNAYLSGLAVSEGTLSPSFDKNETRYTVNVPNEITSLRVTPTVEDSLASVEVNGQSVTSSNPDVEINLNAGNNTISVTVTAEDGTTKVYTITVRRSFNVRSAEEQQRQSERIGVVRRCAGAGVST